MYLRVQLSCIEYSAKFVSYFEKWWFILPISCVNTWVTPLYIVLFGSGILLIDCLYRPRGDHTLIMYPDHPTVSYVIINPNTHTPATSWAIGYIEGTGNHITSIMVYPPYQGHGLGRQLLHDYLYTFSKENDTYWFKTSRSFDTFYITNRLNMKKKVINNWYSHKIECYK